MDLGEILDGKDEFGNGSTKYNSSPNLQIPVPYTVFIIISTLFGTVGNTLIIGTVLSTKKLKNVCNIFIVNLAIADLCVTGFVNPFSLLGVFVGDHWFMDKHILCEVVASVCLTSCYCSLQSIGAISFNRYIHICHNKLYSRLFTPTKTVLMAVSLWTISFLMEMPSFFGWGDHIYDLKTRSCIWDRTADLSYTLFFSCVGVGFPVMLITGSYLKIYLYVRKSRNQVSTYTGVLDKSQTDMKVSTRLTQTLFIIFVVFVSCWAPYAIVVTADVNNTFPELLHLYVLLFAHMNSSLNWLVYGATNRDFRRGYLRFLRLHRVPCLKRFMTIGTEAKPNLTHDTSCQIAPPAIANSVSKLTEIAEENNSMVRIPRKQLLTPRMDI